MAYAQAGNLPGYAPEIDAELLNELVAANSGKRVIPFIRKPVLGDGPVAFENRRLIAAAAEPGFTVNLPAGVWTGLPSWGSPLSGSFSPEPTPAARFGTRLPAGDRPVVLVFVPGCLKGASPGLGEGRLSRVCLSAGSCHR